MQIQNLFVLLTEAIAYFGVMALLLEARGRIGIGVFIAVLGVMHFMETYLAAVFYVELPFGIISPGSSVLFSGKLFMILLVYIKEDAAAVRQPIYGLLAGNFLIVGLSLLLKLHVTLPAAANRPVDLAFIDDMGVLMVWGTSLLYLDALAIVLLYERSSRWLGNHILLRMALCGAAVLTFDQAGFYAALHYVSGAPIEVFWGGWFAKIAAAILFASLSTLYLRLSRGASPKARQTIGDLFNDLTFRQRYEDLLARTALDSLTGVRTRERLETEGPDMVRIAIRSQRPVSVLVIDADHFKLINDRFGHLEGDKVLRDIAMRLQEFAGSAGTLYRFGGEEFVMILDGQAPREAVAVADRLRLEIVGNVRAGGEQPVSISIGVASAPLHGQTLLELISVADKYLYGVKRGGRNAVGGVGVEGDRDGSNPAQA